MATNINTILGWFKTGLRPTQAQFWATWQSFWHKDEKMPTSSIEGLENILSAKAEREQLEGHKTDAGAHTTLFAQKTDKGDYEGSAQDLKENIDSLQEALATDIENLQATDISTKTKLEAIQGKIDGINQLLASDDLDLDTLQEIVNKIKAEQTRLSNEITRSTQVDLDLDTKITNLQAQANINWGIIPNSEAEIVADNSLLTTYITTQAGRTPLNNDQIYDTDGNLWSYNGISLAWVNLEGDNTVALATSTNPGIAKIENTPTAGHTDAALSSDGAFSSLSLKVNTSDKSTDINADKASTTKIPVVKAMYDWATGLFAPLNSPNFTGNPTAPSPTLPQGLATKDYVDKLSGKLIYKIYLSTATGTFTINFQNTSKILSAQKITTGNVLFYLDGQQTGFYCIVDQSARFAPDLSKSVLFLTATPQDHQVITCRVYTADNLPLADAGGVLVFIYQY